MKAILQLNLDSPFNKNYYRTRKNKLQITKQDAFSQYTFDNICYDSQDTNSSIIYDIVIDYSQKNKSKCIIQSTASINIQQTTSRVIEQKRVQHSSHQNISTGLIEDHREPQFIYTVIFDQITQSKTIQAFIKQISATQIFKKQKIKISHFVCHQNGIYDFHKKKMHLSQTQRQQLDRQYAKFTGSIQDNFMWVYNKQINLSQEIKLSNIPHLTKTLSYITADQFNKLSQPTLGLQLASNLTKAEEIQHKQLQNKKILQIYIINIGNKIRVSLILFNYNKNYSLNCDQQKQLAQLYMMHGTMTGQIKYQTIKVQILNKLLKNSQKLYYVMYFPGPRLTVALNQQSHNSLSNNFSKIHKINQYNMNKSLFNSQITGGKSTSQTFCKNGSLLMNRSKATEFSRVNISPQKKDKQLDIINSMFNSYNFLKTKDKDSLQKIIKQYLTKKQDNLKGQLQRVKQRVKQLKLNQRIQQCEVTDLKNKCTKALQKMSQSIIQLHKMGINNIERHMDWLKIIIDEKKQHIKQKQQDIEDINKKTIENRKSHQYFYNKMVQFRDKLKQKQLQSAKYQLKTNTPTNQQPNQKQKVSPQKTYLNYLSLAQLEQLQQHKQRLKSRMIQKLKKSSEKKQFFEALAQLRSKASKIEITRLQQKYFDLLHD